VAKRVLLLSGVSSNLGDQAIFAGFARVFGEACDEAGIDVEVDVAFIYAMKIREAELAEINERYDAVILAGGGFIYHRPDDESASGWGLDIPEALLSQLQPRLGVYAAGYNYRAHSAERFPGHTAAHIRATVAKAAHFSVREHGSRDMLRERFGVTEPLDVVPDAAFHCETSRQRLPFPDSRRKVAVCLRMDMVEERFRSFDGFLAELIAGLRTLVDDGAQIVYITHVSMGADDYVVRQMRQAFPVYAVHEKVPMLYEQASPERGEALAAIYSQMDLVIGQRLHSLIMPFAQGVPVVSMTSTRSSLWMQRYFGVDEQYHLDVDDLGVRSLVRAARGALRDEALSAHAVARTAELRAEGERAIRGLVEAVL